jgi:small-conductance mechanosensitive channel
MLETASHIIKMTEYLLDGPALKEFFLKFGESGLKSGLKFVLDVWAKKYNLPDDVKDAINSRLAERFAAEGIEIPFPQMEVRLKNKNNHSILYFSSHFQTGYVPIRRV